MKILGTICAREGSKGIKNKNIRNLKGKPLIAFTIEYLKKWGKADKIVCSTDSKKIAEIAKRYGAEIPILRPKELATDTASKIEALKHIVKFCETQDSVKYDIVVDLDPTAPLRRKIFLEEAFKKFLKSDANNLYSVNKARKNPYFNMVELDEKGYANLSKQSNVVRRQDAKPVFEMNASIYIYNRDFLLNTNSVHSDKTIIYEMPDIASIDIDNEIDFLFIEFLLKNEVFKFD
jgi:N-acylneuraminate cytidylyltransferase/CMP-N,N'-diacetyllegionaminic acid synthase